MTEGELLITNQSILQKEIKEMMIAYLLFEEEEETNILSSNYQINSS